VELQIDSWRWSSAPFYIRVGKSLPTTTTEVVVKLKCPPQDVFHEEDLSHSSHVRFRLSPEVVIALGARAKLAGERMVGEEVELSVRHQGPDEMEPYERLIGDAMAGDATLFARADAVEAAWAIVEPILDSPTPVHLYERGSWGPGEADRIAARRLARAAMTWLPCERWASIAFYHHSSTTWWSTHIASPIPTIAVASGAKSFIVCTSPRR
jgi:glucose-6-phosphate 1-dehydrogenase